MKTFDQPKTRTQIAEELGISYITFWRWLKKNEIILPDGLVYPAQQKEVYEKMYGKKI